MNDPRGSIWRVWDLHVHTPASFHWNGGKQFRDMNADEEEQALRAMVEAMNASDAAVFAFMDYWTFDGYLRLQKFLAAHTDIVLRKLVLPGIELRIEAPVNYRMNIHLICSNELNAQHLNDLKSGLQVLNVERPLSDDALVQFAKTLDPSKAKVHGFDAPTTLSPAQLLALGSKTALITRESLHHAIRRLPKDNVFIIMPYDTSDGLLKLDWKNHPQADNYFMQSAHIFETRDPDNVDLFLGKRTERNKVFFENFFHTLGGKAKPAICGSDAHRLQDYGKFPNNRPCWIKADTTFLGLRQVTIEPESRTFIGERPDKLTVCNQNRTKFIQGIRISKVPTSTTSDRWFDNITLEFNPDLVAIIGNKGMGKSALADVIALLGAAKNQAHFSFLTLKRFLSPPDNPARNYQATLTWCSDESRTLTLDAPENAVDVQRVKYIPQNYLETVCTDLRTDKGSPFDQELQAVIYSHVPTADRVGQPTLDDLITYKTQEIERTIELLTKELANLNVEIVAMEQRSTPTHKQTLLNNVAMKEQELIAHDKAKPLAPATSETPDSSGTANAAVLAQIAELTASRGVLEKQITTAKEEQARCSALLAAAERVVQNTANLARQVEMSRKAVDADLALLGLSFDAVITFRVNTDPIEELRNTASTTIQSLAAKLDAKIAGSLLAMQADIDVKIETLKSKLDEPARKKQAYEAALVDWNRRREALIGKVEDSGSLASLNQQVKDLELLPERLTLTRNTRSAKTKEIFTQIQQLCSVYQNLYLPVQKFAKDHPLICNRFRLEFNVSLLVDDFPRRLFEAVSQGVTGSFCGIEQGNKLLQDIIDRSTFTSADGVVAFVEQVIDHLTHDRRDREGKPVDITSILKKGHTVAEVYNMVFSLGYLRPRYAMRLGGKELHQLSPGERGTLLLLFYMLIDKDNCPLLIDQPEENLDNHTIYSLLVPCIKEAKKRRQIFLVTHNPNLAVVCDAEQVVHSAKVDSSFQYTSGAIESPASNAAVVNILEGTRPAFDNREAKYMPQRPAAV